MGFSRDGIQAIRNYFLEKLRSEKQRNDVGTRREQLETP